jgi:hypothetical protein
MRVLENNNKPATHFIEVWRDPVGNINNDMIDKISVLDIYLECTKIIACDTIAIFKIRAK